MGSAPTSRRLENPSACPIAIPIVSLSGGELCRQVRSAAGLTGPAQYFAAACLLQPWSSLAGVLVRVWTSTRRAWVRRPEDQYNGTVLSQPKHNLSR